VVNTGELHRLATYGSATRCVYAGTLGCCIQANATIATVINKMTTRLRADLSVRLVSTSHVQIRSVFKSDSPLFFLYLGEHDGNHIRSQTGEIITRVNRRQRKVARPNAFGDRVECKNPRSVNGAPSHDARSDAP